MPSADATTFDDRLEIGSEAERAIDRWLRRRGMATLPLYQYSKSYGRGPRLYAPDGKGIVVPDILAFPTPNEPRYVECKSKGTFSYSLKHKCWQTGIDYDHYLDYIATERVSGCQVWILFLSRRAPDKPPITATTECPLGLYGATLSYLQANESHRYPDDRPEMVYWNVDKLRLMATLDELQRGDDGDGPSGDATCAN